MPEISTPVVDYAPQSSKLTMPPHSAQEPALLALPPSLDASNTTLTEESHATGEDEKAMNENNDANALVGDANALGDNLKATQLSSSNDGGTTVEPKQPSSSSDGSTASATRQDCAPTDESLLGELNQLPSTVVTDVSDDCEQLRHPPTHVALCERKHSSSPSNEDASGSEQSSSEETIHLVTSDSTAFVFETDETELPTPPPGSESHTAFSSPSEPREDSFCPRCAELYEENDHLSRKEARLRQRLRDALETAQTHGQRLLRAAYQEKVEELMFEHAHKTTEMLNMQKKCFEDELEAVDAESQAALSSLSRERDAERQARMRAEERFQREREIALEKTTATMVAVQRKMAQLHARATRLDREKKSLTAAVSEKQVMIEVLASAAAAKDVERRRLDLLSKSQEKERERKDSLVDALQSEVARLKEMLGQERQVNLNLIAQMDEVQGERNGDLERHKNDMDDCKQQSKKEVDRLGRLFTSMIQDFTNVQSDVSTND